MSAPAPAAPLAAPPLPPRLPRALTPAAAAAATPDVMVAALAAGDAADRAWAARLLARHAAADVLTPDAVTAILREAPDAVRELARRGGGLAPATAAHVAAWCIDEVATANDRIAGEALLALEASGASLPVGLYDQIGAALRSEDVGLPMREALATLALRLAGPLPDGEFWMLLYAEGFGPDEGAMRELLAHPAITPAAVAALLEGDWTPAASRVLAATPAYAEDPAWRARLIATAHPEVLATLAATATPAEAPALVARLIALAPRNAALVPAILAAPVMDQGLAGVPRAALGDLLRHADLAVRTFVMGRLHRAGRSVAPAPEPDERPGLRTEELDLAVRLDRAFEQAEDGPDDATETVTPTTAGRTSDPIARRRAPGARAGR